MATKQAATKKATKKTAARKATPKRVAAKPATGHSEVVAALSAVMRKNAKGLVVTDVPRGTNVMSTLVFRGRNVWIGAVQDGKSYVSYHLMPVYMFPDLMKDAPKELLARKQGKGCFNFRTVDRALFAQLGELTRAAFARFQKDGPAHLAKYEKKR